VIRFSLPGYRPLTKAINGDLRRLDVVLQSGENKWTPQQCSASSSALERLGWPMKLSIPEGTTVESEIGADITVHAILLGPGLNSGKMEVTSGPMLGRLLPRKALLVSSSIDQERDVGCHDGVDIRGHDEDGMRWRFTGLINENIEYSRVSDKAADFFDAIIDSLCCADF
jgi:hypothetical protein